jgi:hypothetical protein
VSNWPATDLDFRGGGRPIANRPQIDNLPHNLTFCIL